jgi:hypothetical protein
VKPRTTAEALLLSTLLVAHQCANLQPDRYERQEKGRLR